MFWRMRKFPISKGLGCLPGRGRVLRSRGWRLQRQMPTLCGRSRYVHSKLQQSAIGSKKKRCPFVFARMSVLYPRVQSRNWLWKRNKRRGVVSLTRMHSGAKNPLGWLFSLTMKNVNLNFSAIPALFFSNGRYLFLVKKLNPEHFLLHCGMQCMNYTRDSQWTRSLSRFHV